MKVLILLVVYINGVPSRTDNNLGFSLSPGYHLSGISLYGSYYPSPNLLLEGGVGTSFIFTATTVGIGYIPFGTKNDLSPIIRVNLSRLKSTGILEMFAGVLANFYLGIIDIFLFDGYLSVEEIKFGRIPPIYSIDMHTGFDYVSSGGFRVSFILGPSLFILPTDTLWLTNWELTGSVGIGYQF